MTRTTVWLTKNQREGLAQAAKEAGLCSAHILRIYVNEGLARRKRQQK